MPYKISGISRVTREPIKPFVSNAPSEVAARADAVARGIIVRSVRVLPGDSSRQDRAPVPPPSSTLHIGSLEYEFSLRDHLVMSSLARYMNIVASFLIATSALASAGMAYLRVITPAFVANALIALILGILIRVAAKRFRNVADTEGDDINHLMSALAGLKTVYAVQAWTILLVVGAVILTIGTLSLQRF